MAADDSTKLSPKQLMFCELFASDREFFGNGTESYIEAYDVDLTKKGAYNGARASASRLLTNANILKKINELLDLEGFNDVAVDKQLKFVIAQNADLSSKVAGIREYNKLKSRITDYTDNLNRNQNDDVTGMSVEELRARAEALRTSASH